MPEANGTPAQQQSGAGDAATPKPAQEELQKIRDGVFAEARKKFEPEIEAQKKALEEAKKTFEAELAKERERALKAEKALTEAEQRRIARLEERAKALPDAAQKLAAIAKERGSEAYEEALASAEALVNAAKPKVQGGNLDGSLDSVRAAQQAELSKLPDGEKLHRAREIDARMGRK